MSFPALAWASKYRAESGAIKLVLLGYADRHNEETGCAYPSVAWLCEFSSLNRKTVIAAVAKLEAAGILTDTGGRQGESKQIKVYRLHMETVPKTGQSPKRDSPKKSVKQSQKRDTDTVRTLTPSEAKASSGRGRRGAAPSAAEFCKVVFGAGTALLVSAGKSEKAARSLIGRWRGSCGDAELLMLIRQSETEAHSDPVAWLTAAVGARGGKRSPKRSQRPERVSAAQQIINLESMATNYRRWGREDDALDAERKIERLRLAESVPA